MILHNNSFKPVVKNLMYIKNLIQRSNSCISNSHLFCLNPIFYGTGKLFDEIPQRSCSLLNSKRSFSPGRFVELETCGQVFMIFFLGIMVFLALLKLKTKQPEQAIGVFKSMLLLHDQRPNYVTILSVIRAVGALDREK